MSVCASEECKDKEARRLEMLRGIPLDRGTVCVKVMGLLQAHTFSYTESESVLDSCIH